MTVFMKVVFSRMLTPIHNVELNSVQNDEPVLNDEPVQDVNPVQDINPVQNVNYPEW